MLLDAVRLQERLDQLPLLLIPGRSGRVGRERERPSFDRAGDGSRVAGTQRHSHPPVVRHVARRALESAEALLELPAGSRREQVDPGRERRVLVDLMVRAAGGGTGSGRNPRARLGSPVPMR